MLTKQDLSAIRGVVKAEVELGVKQQFKILGDKIEDLEIKLDERTSDLSMSIFRLRAEFKDEVKNIKRQLNKTYKDQEVIISFFNKEYLGLLKRVEKIEGQVSLLA